MHDNCPDNCPLVPRVEALERANEQHSATHREIFDRMRQVEKENAIQETHHEQLMGKIEEAVMEIKALSARLATLETKPGKRWDGMVDKAIWAIAAAVIAFLLAKVGL